MKIALVHDWLTGLRGGERCLQAFLDLYPDADIHTLIHIPGTTEPRIDERVVQTSRLQSLPGVKNYYRWLLPFYPSAVRGLKIEGYDLVISLSHAAAKNITLSPSTFHISYCFTPMRYIWDQADAYFGKMTPLLTPLIMSLRRWDTNGAEGVSKFVAISEFVQSRIKAYYGRDAAVVYPPVNTSWIEPIRKFEQGDAFLFAGALVPYKRPRLVIEAFNKLGLPLRVVGTGPEEGALRRAANSNIQFIGHVTDRELGDIYRSSRALVFPGTEDFGLMPVECMAAGRPVIGIHDGGIRESVTGIKHWEKGGELPERPTGVYIRKSEAPLLDSLISAIYYFIDNEDRFNPEFCINQAKRFSPDAFYSAWGSFLSKCGFQNEPEPSRFERSSLERAANGV